MEYGCSVRGLIQLIAFDSCVLSIDNSLGIVGIPPFSYAHVMEFKLSFCGVVMEMLSVCCKNQTHPL